MPTLDSGVASIGKDDGTCSALHGRSFPPDPARPPAALLGVQQRLSVQALIPGARARLPAPGRPLNRSTRRSQRERKGAEKHQIEIGYSLRIPLRPLRSLASFASTL